LGQRLIALATAIETNRRRSGEILDEGWDGFTHAVNASSTDHSYFDGTPAIVPL